MEVNINNAFKLAISIPYGYGCTWLIYYNISKAIDEQLLNFTSHLLQKPLISTIIISITFTILSLATLTSLSLIALVFIPLAFIIVLEGVLVLITVVFIIEINLLFVSLFVISIMLWRWIKTQY